MGNRLIAVAVAPAIAAASAVTAMCDAGADGRGGHDQADLPSGLFGSSVALPGPEQPLPSRGKPSGFAAFNSSGSKSSGQPWNAIGTSRRRIAVMPTEVRSGWVVDGHGPLCRRLQTTATPVGQTS